MKVLQPYTILQAGEFSEMSMYLRVDSQHEIITTDFTSQVDVIAKVGGLYTSSIAVLYTLCVYFTQKLFFNSLIKKLYSHEKVMVEEN